MATCPNSGKSNIQRVFAVIEDVPGVLQRPDAASFVLPSGQASMSQTPSYSDSEELSASLNTLAQFQDAVQAGDISIPMYVRLNSNYSAPQGDSLLTAMMGEVQAGGTVTAALDEQITATATSLKVKSVTGGFLPPRGVISIGSEKIRYTKKTAATPAGTYNLTGCVRGFAGTTAATQSANAAVTLASRVYLQAVCRPTVSVWMQFDHAVLFMSGCVVTNTVAPLSNQGGQTLTVSLQGRKMGWAGKGHIVSVNGSVVTLEDKEANGYSVGALLKNVTHNESASTAYTVTAVDTDNDTLTLSPAPASGWQAGDVLAPWLPDAPSIGEPVESRDARVFINGAIGTRREGNITIATPTSFMNEIGDAFPGENADGKRSITMSGGLYFRAEDAKEFGLGYNGYEMPMDILLGNKAGGTMALAFPRVKFNTPAISADGEFYTLTQDGTALGVSSERAGESSLYIILE